MNWKKMAQGALGFYLLLPSVEDAATGGLTLAPSAAIGGYLLLDAFGVKL